MEEKRIVKPWQAGLMLLVGIAVIIVGLLVMKLNNRIVLALDGVIMCLMAWCFGIPYAELQQGIKETVSSMIVAILILLAVGVLVGTWMASGTVPVMIYYGMKVLTPGLFLPVVCILCTLMSTMAGTSWGTLATVGVACMGVAQGLGVPLPAAAGAVCTSAFFGDKVSPLPDSPVITATVCEVPLMDGIRHALISTGPAYLISLVFYFVYGLRYSGGSVGGEVYEDILSTVSAEFWLSPVLLLPVLVVVVLILMKKPTIPTFIAGIAAGAVMAMLCQGVSLHDILTVMYSGFSADTGLGRREFDAQPRRLYLDALDHRSSDRGGHFRRAAPHSGRCGRAARLCGAYREDLSFDVARCADPARGVFHDYGRLLCVLSCRRQYGEGPVSRISS